MIHNLPRGLRDFTPTEYAKIRYIYEKFIDTSEKFCFSVMEPSTIELFETLALKSGSEIEKEIYTFYDKGGRKLALRFDLTVGLTRYVVSNSQIPKPIKVSSYGSMWRYDEPQYGRYRNFYQWDAEIFGADIIESGGEIINFSEQLLSNIGLKNIQILVSSRKVLEIILKKHLPASTDFGNVLRVIDKRDKIGLEKMKEMLCEINKSEDGIDKIIELASISDTKKNAIKRIEEIDRDIIESDGGKELINTLEHAESLGTRNLKVDLGIVRGLDYYDGVIYEIKLENSGGLGSLVGGGNFNNLIKALGEKFTGFGAAGGIERIYLAVEKTRDLLLDRVKQKIFVANVNQETYNQTLSITSKLREAGFSAEYDLSNRKLRGKLEYAEKINCDKAIIVGKNEIDEGKIIVKNLLNREQKKIDIKRLIEILKEGI